MNLRRFFPKRARESELTRAGIPTWIVESDWQVRERLFVERITRYLRLGTWLMALSAAILFLSVAASVASIEFGIVPPAHTGGEELFSRGSADPGGAPNIWP